MPTKTKTPVDGYQIITDLIIEQLEAGTVPWRRPWRSAQGFGPTSLSTGKEYRGVNHLVLSMQAFAAGYESLYWGTYKQIKERGGQVRKGEKGTQVVLWKPIEKEQDGEKKRFLLMRLFTVFNAEQADWSEGAPKAPEREDDGFTPIERAEHIANHMPQRPSVRHGGNRAFYSPNLDYVQMPMPEQFATPESYYATLYHELVHSTGHESRIGRDGIEAFAGFGSESYSKEELVAEMGAAYLCAEAEIEPRFEQNAAYIASWLKVLQNDKKFVVSAAAAAGKAADFILGKERG